LSIIAPPARRSAVAALLALALAVAALALPASSQAARTPTYAVGDQVVFRIVSQHPNARRYGVFLTIASRKRTDRYGGLKRTPIGTFSKMTARGRGRFEYKTPPYTFDTWFMMNPGTYYWQTQVTDCTVAGCAVYSRIKTFKVA
jgi:hypothetical protein